MRQGWHLVLRVLGLATIAAWAFVAAFALGVVDARAVSVTRPSIGQAAASLPGPRLEHRSNTPQTSVEAVSKTVMCPSCNTTLDQSNAPAAERMRTYIVAAVRAGWTAGEIRAGLLREYDGDRSILASPGADGLGLVAWIVPGIVALIALSGGLVLMRRWRSSSLGTPRVDGQARSTSSS